MNMGIQNFPAALSLRWPDWCPPTYEDKQTQATALKTHTDAGHLSTETAKHRIKNNELSDQLATANALPADDYEKAKAKLLSEIK